MKFSSTALRSNTLVKHPQIKVGRGIQTFARLVLTLVVLACSNTQDAELVQYDLAFNGGRVIDPESGFDQQANVAINGGKITAVSELPLSGIESIDASGLVINYGASTSQLAIRLKDQYWASHTAQRCFFPSGVRAATKAIQADLKHGIENGGLGIGFLAGR
jgi:hypothetical protein